MTGSKTEFQPKSFTSFAFHTDFFFFSSKACSDGISHNYLDCKWTTNRNQNTWDTQIFSFAHRLCIHMQILFIAIM